MFKKTIAVALTAIVSCLSCIAQTQGQPDKTASVKAQVRKIGIGESSVVRVKLKDGTEQRGYLSQIENDSFTVTDQATKKAASVSYGDVRSLKVNGKGMSTGTKILIGVGIGVAIAAGVIAYLATHLKITNGGHF
jgi:hypothetical protein